MAQKSKSWVHELFWPKHPDTGHYRFCKICNEECPDPREVAELQKKGTPLSSMYIGVVQNDCSPSSMINHVRAKHGDHLPEHTPVKRKRSDLEEEEMPCKDHRLLREWATNMCLGSMYPVKMVRDPNVRKPLHKRLGGLPTDTQIRSALQDVISDIRAQVRSLIGEAQRQGIQFILSADTWKPKTKKRPHFLAIYLDFLEPTWEHRTVCCSVTVAKPPRTGREHWVGNVVDSWFPTISKSFLNTVL